MQQRPIRRIPRIRPRPASPEKHRHRRHAHHQPNRSHTISWKKQDPLPQHHRFFFPADKIPRRQNP